jgi:hypothetical protein
MAIFSLIAKLGLDGAAYETGLKKASSLTDKFRNSISGQLGAALSVAAVGAFASKVVQTADAIGDLSEQLNISTDDVQRLQILANQTGVSFEAMAKSITAVSQERLKAVEEGGKARDYFKALGISVAELNDKSISNIDLITRMGKAHQNSGNSAQTQAAMIEILGVKAFKAAGALTKINELGPIDLISKEQIDALGKLADRLDEITRQMVVSAVPEMTFWADALERAAKDEKGVSDGITGILQQLGGKGSIVKAAFQEAFAKPEEAAGRFEALPIPRGTIGRIDSRNKDRMGGFTSSNGWVDTFMGQVRLQTADLKSINKNTSSTVSAINGN